MSDRFLLAEQRFNDVDAPTGTSYQMPWTDFFQRRDSNTLVNIEETIANVS